MVVISSFLTVHIWIFSVVIKDKITVLYTNGVMEISKYWIMGGWKKWIINGWVRHNAVVDLKMWGEGNPFQSNFGAPEILSKCIPELPWQNWHEIHFLLHIHACSLRNNSLKWIHFLCGVFIFWVSNCLKIGQVGQKPYWISFFFFALNYKQL